MWKVLRLLLSFRAISIQEGELGIFTHRDQRCIFSALDLEIFILGILVKVKIFFWGGGGGGVFVKVIVLNKCCSL